MANNKEEIRRTYFQNWEIDETPQDVLRVKGKFDTIYDKFCELKQQERLRNLIVTDIFISTLNQNAYERNIDRLLNKIHNDNEMLQKLKQMANPIDKTQAQHLQMKMRYDPQFKSFVERLKKE